MKLPATILDAMRTGATGACLLVAMGCQRPTSDSSNGLVAEPSLAPAPPVAALAPATPTAPTPPPIAAPVGPAVASPDAPPTAVAAHTPPAPTSSTEAAARARAQRRRAAANAQRDLLRILVSGGTQLPNGPRGGPGLSPGFHPRYNACGMG